MPEEGSGSPGAGVTGFVSHLTWVPGTDSGLYKNVKHCKSHNCLSSPVS